MQISTLESTATTYYSRNSRNLASNFKFSTGTLVSCSLGVLCPWPTSLAAVCPQKCTYQVPHRTPSSFFFDCGFFSGCTFAGKLQVPTSTIQFLWWGLPIQAFLGPGWGEVLILSEFIWEYFHVHLQKKTYFGTPPARSETGFRILSKFWSRTDL